MGTPNGDWNRSRGNRRATASGRRNSGSPEGHRSGAARGSVSFFRKALSLGTWLLILAMLIPVARGLNERTFARLFNGIKVLRHPAPAATETRRPPPAPPPGTPEDATPAASEAADLPPPEPLAPAEPPPAPPISTAEPPPPLVVADSVPVPAPQTSPTVRVQNENQPPRIAEVIVPPARNGNFFVHGKINGQDVLFVIDTGASAVAIPEKLRWKLNLTRGGYRQSATANGIAGMFETEIKELSVGPIQLRNIAAVINPNAPDETVLLGMTALRQVRMLQQNGQMILQQEISLENAVASSSSAPPPPKLKKSVKDCMADDKVVNARVLKCMQGEEADP